MDPLFPSTNLLMPIPPAGGGAPQGAIWHVFVRKRRGGARSAAEYT